MCQPPEWSERPRPSPGACPGGRGRPGLQESAQKGAGVLRVRLDGDAAGACLGRAWITARAPLRRAPGTHTLASPMACTAPAPSVLAVTHPDSSPPYSPPRSAAGGRSSSRSTAADSFGMVTLNPPGLFHERYASMVADRGLRRGVVRNVCHVPWTWLQQVVEDRGRHYMD